MGPKNRKTKGPPFGRPSDWRKQIREVVVHAGVYDGVPASGPVNVMPNDVRPLSSEFRAWRSIVGKTIHPTPPPTVPAFEVPLLTVPAERRHVRLVVQPSREHRP